MTWLLLLGFGAIVGTGVLVLVTQLSQTETSGPVALAQLDTRLARGRRQAALTADRRHETENPRLRKLGAELSEMLARRGRKLPMRVTAALSLVGMSRETFLARTAIGALVGFFLPSLVLLPFTLTGAISLTTPLWLSVFAAVGVGLTPFADVRRQAEERRRGFRHVVSSFLDLVAMNLAGGRGVPEALQAASHISDSWAMVRIRDTLQAARLQGVTPWAALGELGDEVDVDELRDLAAALALVAEDGAKVRDSLSARAASMRRRELADAEGRAAAKSQSMLVAQLFLCVGFLLFLLYPAVARILG
jgi:tight adherence protein C